MKSRRLTQTVLIFVVTIVIVNSQVCRQFNKTSLSQACGYNSTAKFIFDQHYQGARRAVEIFTTRSKDNYYKLYDCSPFADLMICSLYLPKCVEGVHKPVVPCREVCEEFIQGCKDRLMKTSLEWIVGMCSILPKISKDKTKRECFLPPNFNRTTTGYTELKCHPMKIPACKGLGYKYTILTPTTQEAYKSYMNRTIASYTAKNHTDGKCVEKMRKLICAETVPPCFSGSLHYNCREECQNTYNNCTKHFWYGADMCIEFPEGQTALGYCKQKDWPRSANWPAFKPSLTVPPTGLSKPTDKTFTTTLTHRETWKKTHDPPAAVASTASSTNHGAIAGVVIAILIIPTLAVIGLYVYKRHKRRSMGYKRHGHHEFDDDTIKFEL